VKIAVDSAAELRVGRVCCFVVPLAFGALAIALGQDANWDLRNYHWYNPYALLTGRFTFDLAPATFYNPLLDVPLYLVAQHLPARLCGFLLGIVQGLNFIALYGLAQTVLPSWARWGRGGGGAIIAALGVLGGGGLCLVGTTFNDNVVSVLILTALWVVTGSMRADQTPSATALAIAGVLTGAAVGLKLPTAIFGVGLLTACIFITGNFTARLRSTVAFGLPALVAMLVTGGYWSWWLWSTFHNPIYPYYNNFFGSAQALSATYRDERFLPTSLVDAVLFPFAFSANSQKVGETDFTDYRIVMLYVVLLISVVWMLIRTRRAGAREPVSPELRFVLAAAIGSYVVWLRVFAIYRYAVTLEMLAPLLSAALIATWPIRMRRRIALAVLCAFVLVVGTRPGSWGRVEWGPRFVEVTAPRLDDPRNAMVLMVGFEPMSWVIPSFPADVPFVRLQGYSHGPDDGDVGLAREARLRVANHRGPFYLLSSNSEQDLAEKVLARLGMVGDFGSCEAIAGNLDHKLRLCPVSRSGDAP